MTRARLRIAAVLILWMCAFAPALGADEVITLDPSQTKVEFTLAATMHTVHGAFRLKGGEIHLDLPTGKASGAVVVDTKSGDTGNSGRDRKMHFEVLESSKFPEIVFSPTRLKPTVDLKGILEGRQQTPSRVEISGVIRLHGQDHEVTLVADVQRSSDGRLDVSTKFSVPYVQWGLKNPSTFLLRVSETVQLEVHSTVRVGPALAAQ